MDDVSKSSYMIFYSLHLFCFRHFISPICFSYVSTFIGIDFLKLLQYNQDCDADMAKLADAHGSGPCELKFLQVQILLSAPDWRIIVGMKLFRTLYRLSKDFELLVNIFNVSKQLFLLALLQYLINWYSSFRESFGIPIFPIIL